MKVCILKYQGGNVQSVVFAINRLGLEPIISDDPIEIQSADKIIFPGVGEASNCMKSLQEKGLDILIPKLTQPLLGICVGLQLLCKHSEESNTKGLGVFDTEVRKFKDTGIISKGEKLKVPQMGWNTIAKLKTPLFKGVMENSFVYYVHSFAAGLCADTIATTDYSFEYSAALQNKNFYAVQFHTEKSSDVGAKILKNFIEM